MGTVSMIVISTGAILVISFFLAHYLSKKTNPTGDWALGGRSLPIYVIVLSQYATAMGGGMLVAHVGIGYQFGWSAITYGILTASTLLILSLISNWLRKENFTTVPDIIEKIYGKSNVLLLLAALMTLIVPFGWICSQLVAFAKLYGQLTGIPMNTLIIGFGIVSLAFVLPAGLSTVAWSDFIFGCLMLTMSVVSAIFAYNMTGGMSEIVKIVPPQNIAFPKGLGAVGLPVIALWSLSILPGGLTNQLYYQRIYAVDTTKNARKSLIISAVIILTADVWASFMGMCIRTLNPGLAQEAAMGWFLGQIPPWVLAIFSGFLVATIVSTVDSAVQSVVVNLTRDVYKKLIKPGEDDEKKMLKLSRILSVATVFVAIIIAIVYPQVLSLLVATYAFSAAGLLCPIFVGYILKDKNILTAQGAIGSMLCGFAGCAIGMIVKSQIPYVAFGIVGSFVGLIFISLITKKTENISA